jgi:hypothetical protein
MYRFITYSLLLLLAGTVSASGPIEAGQFDNVKKTELTSDEQRQRLSTTAGLLADYEIKAKKLVNSLSDNALAADNVNKQASELMDLSTEVIESARFRLPQCDEYLAKTMELKGMLGSISHESLENDYHHDGALPKAPAECYHTKDLFVHPATVMILTRDDPALAQKTRSTIADEINEVLAHTEVVRQLVIY